MTKKQVLYRNNTEDDRDKGEKSIKKSRIPIFLCDKYTAILRM